MVVQGGVRVKGGTGVGKYRGATNRLLLERWIKGGKGVYFGEGTRVMDVIKVELEAFSLIKLLC